MLEIIKLFKNKSFTSTNRIYLSFFIYIKINKMIVLKLK